MSLRAVDLAPARVVLVGTSRYDGGDPLPPNVLERWARWWPLTALHRAHTHAQALLKTPPALGPAHSLRVPHRDGVPRA